MNRHTAALLVSAILMNGCNHDTLPSVASEDMGPACLRFDLSGIVCEPPCPDGTICTESGCVFCP